MAGRQSCLIQGWVMPHVRFSLCRLAVVVLACLTGLPQHSRADETLFPLLSEGEFFGEIPQIFTASRLPQKIEEAAGATTVMDREFIRATGARVLSDLFRFVPGFLVATEAGGRPVVAYHGLTGQASQRMQVYVDGRSVYAPYLFGGVDWSVLSIPLDDIERIEVQRGSNSVTYGANAFLGVVHITTRAAAQSVGSRVDVIQGSGGIADRHFRGGHASAGLQWRVSAGVRSDDGLIGRRDSYQTEYIDVRAEYQPSTEQEWSFASGTTRNRFDSGFDGRVADPLRNTYSESSFIRSSYRHAVDPGQEWRADLSWTGDTGRDQFEIPLLAGDALLVDGTRRANRYALAYHHFNDLGSGWRASWGLGVRQDDLVSPQLFNTHARQFNSAWNGYVNQEWKASAHWILNAGGLLEKDGLAPAQFAPRLSVNWMPSSQHTFKFGYSSAFRSPSLFEQKADWRIVYQDRTLDIRYLSRGGLIPERVRAWDLVYLGQWPVQGLTLDARWFREKLSQLITGERYLVESPLLLGPNAVALDLRNNAAASNLGFEYQLVWRPQTGTLFALSQYFSRPEATTQLVAASMPKRSSSWLVSRDWGAGWSTGFSYTELSPTIWLGEMSPVATQSLVNLKLARRFRWEGMKLETAGVWRKPVHESGEFREGQKIPQQFWLTLGMEY